MTRAKNDKKKLAKTARDEEAGWGGGAVFPVGSVGEGDGASSGGQAAGLFDVGEGVVGGELAEGGGGGTEGGEAPGEVAELETVIASFCPDWQWVLIVQMK